MMRDVTIHLFGEIDDVAAMTEIAEAASREGGLAWRVASTPEEIVDDAAYSSENGDCLTLFANEVEGVDGMFPALRAAARRLGQSYVVEYGAANSGVLNRGIAWRQNSEHEEHFIFGDDDRPIVHTSALKEALEDDLEAVRLLVARTDALADPDAIVVHPHVIEDYAAKASFQSSP